MTHCIMRADKLPEYSIVVGLWRVFPIWTTVQHFGHNNLVPIETLVKNSVDNWDAGILQVKSCFCSYCCAINGVIPIF